MGTHPWRRLRHLTDWLLGWAHLPEGMMGATDHGARIIVLDKRLTQAERRCTLAHELEHAGRSPLTGVPVLDAREEEAVRRAAARRLIPLHRLEDAIRWSRDVREVAEELWVDVPTLEARIRGLHPSERAVLERAVRG